MKKTKNAPVEHDEEETTQYSRESAIKKWLLDDLKKQKYDAAKRAGLSVSKRPGGNPAEGKPSYGISAHESEQDLFAMMDSFLSEKIFSMLEAKINPDNMISPDAKLSGKTPVVASAEGIPPAQYAQAQGVVMVSRQQASVNESVGKKLYNVTYDPGANQYSISSGGKTHTGKTPLEAAMKHIESTKDKRSIAGFARGNNSSEGYGMRFDAHPDHKKYLAGVASGRVLPKDKHHAGVIMQSDNG